MACYGRPWKWTRVLLAGGVLVAVAAAVAVGVTTLRAQGIGGADQGESCIMVLHVTPHVDGEQPDDDYGSIPVDSAPIDGSTYNVEYRTIDPDDPSSKSAWTAPTESPLLNSYLYHYMTDYITDAVLVEWRVTAVGHEGTKKTTNETVISALAPDENGQVKLFVPLWRNCDDEHIPTVTIPYELP